jgi:hypothetical protein
MFGPGRPRYLDICLTEEDSPGFWDDESNDADGQYMSALVNNDTGWLNYLRYNGDAGFSSRNPAYSGSEDAVQEYYLSNGQMDEFPLAWAISASEILEVLEYFVTHRQPAPWIHWHNDSGDGECIGMS